MKLYSGSQVIKFCAITAAVVFVFSLSVGRKSSAKNEAEIAATKTELSAVNEEINPGVETPASEEGQQGNELVEVLQQNPAVIIPVSTSSANYTLDEQQNISVYAACNEAVVNINTKVTSYDWFLEPYVQDGGSGSGSIIDKRGYILTNVHVIQGATKIYVSLFDGTQYEAEVVGQDLDSDLAVIKFDPPSGMELKTISFGDSTALKVGQKVIAIGNPFGMERTMTTGIVSGLGRPIQNSNNRIIRNMIQTDASINPGNSGGPLLDTSGRMIGINTMIMSSSGSSSGVGFAVPAETAVRVVADLIKYGKVNRGTLAVRLVQNSRRIAQYAGLDIATGMLVSEVTKGGNAEAAGLKGGTEAAYYGNRSSVIYLGGDIITKIDDVDVKTLADYYSALESKRPGDIVTVVVRRNKRDVSLRVTL